MIESAFATPRSPVSAAVTARDHVIVQDKPAEFGGKDTGAMASEHLLVALLSCQLSTFRKVADKRRMPEAEVVRLDGDLVFDDADDISEVRLRWTLRGIDDKQAETVTRMTDKVCTISRVLSCPVVVADIRVEA